MKLTTYTKTGNLSKTPLTVKNEVFAGEVNQQLLAQAIRVYLSNQRQGTSRVKTRGEVVRTKKKWYKQKGTGNARHGARSAPIFVGGGVIHGPTGIENWDKKLTQRQQHLALKSALSAQADKIVVCDGFADLNHKTKDAAALIDKIAPDIKRVLLVFDKFDSPVIKSLRNLPHVLLTKANRLNVYEVAASQHIIMTKAAVEILEKRLNKYQSKTKK